MSDFVDAGEINPTILLAQEDLLEFASAVTGGFAMGNTVNLDLQNIPLELVKEDLEDFGFGKHLVVPDPLGEYKLNRPRVATLSVSFSSCESPFEPATTTPIDDEITERSADCSIVMPFSGVTNDGVLFTAEHWITLSASTDMEPPYIASGVELRTFRQILTEELIPIFITNRCSLDSARVFVALCAKYYETNI